MSRWTWNYFTFLHVHVFPLPWLCVTCVSVCIHVCTRPVLHTSQRRGGRNVCIVNTPVCPVQVVGGAWLFSRLYCNIFVTLDVMMCTASILNLCAISIDRWVCSARVCVPSRCSYCVGQQMLQGHLQFKCQPREGSIFFGLVIFMPKTSELPGETNCFAASFTSSSRVRLSVAVSEKQKDRRRCCCA